MSCRRCVVGALILFKLVSLDAELAAATIGRASSLLRHYTMNTARRPAP
jgi:hypothetical protein